MLISLRGAMSSYYYLMTVDGQVTDDERDMFDAIGGDIDAEAFKECRTGILNACQATVERAASSVDRFEILTESVDDALDDAGMDEPNTVSPRLLVWNMLSMAFADGDPAEDELRLIRHVSRRCHVGKDVFQEMELLMLTASALLDEKRHAESSNGTYSQVKPFIDEVDTRCMTLQRAAAQLIGDELAPKPGKAAMPDQDVVDRAKEKIGEGVTPAVNWIQTQAATVADAAGNATKPMIDQAGSTLNSAGHAIGDALNPIGGEVHKQAKNALHAAQNVIGGLFGRK